MTAEPKPQMKRGCVHSKAHIIAIGGGKGGVGKSFVSSSLSIFLSYMGYNTIVVDLDLGASNIHTCLGVPPTPYGVQNLIEDDQILINEVAHKTPFPHLRVISGSNDSLDIANISEKQKSTLLSRIYNTEADFILLDLSAGTHESTVDFFLTAQQRALVVTPDPTSIENAYRFLKTSFFRNVRRFEAQLGLSDKIKNIMLEQKKYGIKNPADLLAVLKKLEPQRGEELHNLLKQYEHKIILNQAHTYKEREIGASIQSVCNKYFDIPTEFIGAIDHDNAVWQSLRKRKHLLVEYPHSRLYPQLLRIAKKITQGYAIRKKAA